MGRSGEGPPPSRRRETRLTYSSCLQSGRIFQLARRRKCRGLRSRRRDNCEWGYGRGTARTDMMRTLRRLTRSYPALQVPTSVSIVFDWKRINALGTIEGLFGRSRGDRCSKRTRRLGLRRQCMAQNRPHLRSVFESSEISGALSPPVLLAALTILAHELFVQPCAVAVTPGWAAVR